MDNIQNCNSCITLVIFNHYIPKVQKTQYVYITNTNRLVLLREIIAIYSEK
jgi:hypothetical protein